MENEFSETIKYPGCGIEPMAKAGKGKVLEYDVIIEQDENGVYVAHVPELPGCHTQGNSLKEVLENASEAIELYLEHAKGKIEHPMKFVGVKKVPVSKAASA
ncbi:MAG: type II toxin-antitoxin system HicB family antitoxin [Candidatus Micrarchaeia archaeon]